MFEVIETINDIGRRVFVVRNHDTGRDLGSFRFHDDAINHMRKLENARMRRLRDKNVRDQSKA